LASQLYVWIRTVWKCITFIMYHKVKMITTAHNIIVKPARISDFLRSRGCIKMHKRLQLTLTEQREVFQARKMLLSSQFKKSTSCICGKREMAFLKCRNKSTTRRIKFFIISSREGGVSICKKYEFIHF
jgi:hypothetical protein